MKFNQSYIGLREDMLKHISSSKSIKVLDIGCATGTNGKYLMDRKLANYVGGIEIDEEMAIIASRYYDKVLTGDLNTDEFLQKCLLQFKDMDVILIGDVLEHLINPWQVLNKFKSCLNKNGNIIFSVPNVRHIDVFIHVFIKGYWPLNERGIFDKTHLRWFTLKNILESLKENDMTTLTIDRNFRFRDRKGSKFPIGGRFLRVCFREFFTFQYIIVCK